MMESNDAATVLKGKRGARARCFFLYWFSCLKPRRAMTADSINPLNEAAASSVFKKSPLTNAIIAAIKTGAGMRYNQSPLRPAVTLLVFDAFRIVRMVLNIKRNLNSDQPDRGR